MWTRRRPIVIYFCFQKVQKFLSLLVWLSIFAPITFAFVRAKQARSQAVTIELKASSASTMTWLITGAIRDHEGLGDGNHWE